MHTQTYPLWGSNPQVNTTQLAQAVELAQRANSLVDQIVQFASVQRGLPAVNPWLSFAPATPAAAQHQWSDPVPWVLGADTGIHPNAAGHMQLAITAKVAACAQWHRWCGAAW